MRGATQGAIRWLGLLSVLVAVPWTPAAAQESGAGSGEASPEAEAALEAGPRVIEVRMVDKGPTRFVFEPAEIDVRSGDVVVWVQTGVMPHNVQFTAAPEGHSPEALPTSPFLTRKGQRYELRIGEEFRSGDYEYICTPHAAMGMRGVIHLVDSAGSTGG